MIENKHLGDGDRFGKAAETFAIFFGTPTFLIGQTVITILWIVLNSIAWLHHWDPMPFLFLNFLYTIQSGYAAPLILLATTRQTARDKIQDDLEKAHRVALATETNTMLQEVKDLIKGKNVHMD